MRSEKDIITLIIHGVGVEGSAALKWFLEKSPAQITLIDQEAQLANLSPQLAPESRVQKATQEDFLNDIPALPKDTLYLRSPGVPPQNPVFAAIKKAGIEHTTPTGYWLSAHTPDNLVTITGTKGKSSTASLTALILQWAGLNAEAMGNIGKTPFDANPTADVICIMELSSYMMHDLPPLPSLHVVTSLYKEHTDWHGSHDAYTCDKLRSFFTEPPSNGLVSQELAALLPEALQDIHFFEDIAPLDKGVMTLRKAQINLTPSALNEAFSAPSLLLALRAAVAICLHANFIRADQLKTVLEKNLPHWRGLPCRQQIVPSSDGVMWVDDTLATVPEATLSALSRWPDNHLHLLLGGKDRGQDFTDLLKACAKRQNLTLYSFSETHAKIAHAAGGMAVIQADTLEELVLAARKNAQKGEIILFSPAAPSAPPHANYMERSAIFQGLISP